MSALDLSARTARRELGALVEPADDHDLIAAFARAVDEARPFRSYFPLGAPDRD